MWVPILDKDLFDRVPTSPPSEMVPVTISSWGSILEQVIESEENLRWDWLVRTCERILKMEGLMANKRMFLVHRQAKIGVMLGKRFGYGWYAKDKDTLGSDIENLFLHIERHPEWDQDDFVLLKEGDETPRWSYGEVSAEGFRMFEFPEEGE